MWPAGGDGGGNSRPEIGAAPSGRVDLVHDRLVPGLHPFFPVNGSSLGGPVGGCSGRPAAWTGTMKSDDLEPFTQLDDEAWMGRSMMSLIAGTQQSVNFEDCVHDQVKGEQFLEVEEGSDEESESDVEPFIVHCEGDSDVDELYPTPTYEELVAEEAPKSKEELQKESKVKQAK